MAVELGAAVDLTSRRPRRSARTRVQATLVPASAFAALLVFAAIEYLRPQDWLRPLAHAPVGIVAGLALVACLARYGRRDLLRDPILRVMALLPLFAALWTPFATNRFWAFQVFKVLLLDWLAIWAIASFVDRSSRLRALLLLLLVAFVAQAVWSVGHSGKGFNAHFMDENDLAVGLCAALPFAVFGMSTLQRTWARAIAAISAVLLVIGVVASESRGGLVALAATGSAMLLFAKRRALILVLLGAGAALMVALTPAAYWADMKTMFDPADETRASRIQFWADARAAWYANPILGVGPGNIPWVIGAYESFDTQTGASAAGRAVHSLYFTLLPEWGLVGTALYVSLFGLFIARCVRILRRPSLGDLEAHVWARALLCGTVACFAGGLFLSLLYYPHLYYGMALAVAVGSLQERTQDRSAAAPRRRPRATPLRLVAAGIVTACWALPAPRAEAATPAPARDAGFTLRLDFEHGEPGTPPEGPDAFDELAAGSQYTREQHYTGTQAAALRIAKGTDGWNSFGGRRFLPADRRVGRGGELWVRVRVLFPAGFSFAADPWLKFLRIDTGRGETHEGYDDWYLDDPDARDPAHVFISEVSGQPSRRCGRSSDNPRRGRWETYEMYVRFDDVAARAGGSGRVRMWKDGVLLCEIDDLPTLATPSSTASAFLFSTYWNGKAPKTQQMYLDDVVITSRRPAARDAHGNPQLGMGAPPEVGG